MDSVPRDYFSQALLDQILRDAREKEFLWDRIQVSSLVSIMILILSFTTVLSNIGLIMSTGHIHNYYNDIYLMCDVGIFSET